MNSHTLFWFFYSSPTPINMRTCFIRVSKEKMGVERVSMDRKSSIEDEPLTLGIDQLRFAREAALYVMNTTSMEDSLRIFTEGLKPVVCAGHNRDVKKGLCVNLIDSEEEDGRMEFPGAKDILSAPF